MKKSILFVLFFFVAGAIFAQPWMKYLPSDAKAKPNFYQLQQAFSKWEKDNHIQKGYFYRNGKKIKALGWKQFKRWEYIWEARTDKNGQFLPSSYLYTQWEKFKASSPKSLMQGRWQLLGPITKPPTYTGQPNGLGRINAVVFDHTDENTFYVCTASGGLWRTTDYGKSWQYLSAALPTLGTSDALVDPQNPAVIYLATGDRDHYDARGMGIWKSYDYGQTWTRVLDSDMTVNMMIMPPYNHLKIIAGATFGIYLTEDGGNTWTRTLADVRIKDLEFHPANPLIVYATGEGRLFKSTDGGYTWTDITSRLNLPVQATRNVLGVSPDEPDWLYVLATNDNGDASSPFLGIYLSTDAGESFTLQSFEPNILGYEPDGSDGGSQAWYDLCIAVDPTDANVIYTGGVNIWKSTDAGKTLKIRAHWTGRNAPAVHADHHDLRFAPDGQTLFSCNDGGIYYTSDGGYNWTDITSGMSIAQVYRIGPSAHKPFLFMNGYQDNGSALAQGTDDFLTVIGGDGMECLIDYSDDNYKFGEIYYGQIYRSVNDRGFISITGNINDQGYWVTPYMLSYENPEKMLVGMVNLWLTNDVRATSVQWDQITDFSDDKPIIALDMRTNSPYTIYFAKKDGRLFRVDNLGSTPTELTANLPFTNASITGIETSDDDPNVVYITGYDKDNSRAFVLKSSDRGQTWTDITGNLPNVYFNCIIRDTASDKNALYLGTFTGVFYLNDDLWQWIDFSSGLPVTDVRELEIFYGDNPAEKHIKAATFGRGTWYSPVYPEYTTDAAVYIYKQSDICLNRPIYIAVENLGQDTLKSAKVYYTLNGKTDSLLWTGSLPPFGQDTIILNGLTSYPGEYTLQVQVTYPNGTVDENIKNNNSVLYYTIEIQKPNYSADFAGGVLPQCWQAQAQWSMTDNNIRGLQSVSASNGYPYLMVEEGAAEASLISPAFDFFGTRNVYLSFNQLLKTTDGQASVDYSEDGQNWHTIYIFRSNRGNDEVADVFLQDISFLAGKSPVFFRFHYSGQAPVLWAIDDFSVKTAPDDNQLTDKVLVYPNPATTMLNISFREQFDYVQVRLLGIDGRVVYQHQQNSPDFISVPVNLLISGIYFLEIKLPQKTVIKKIIIH